MQKTDIKLDIEQKSINQAKGLTASEIFNELEGIAEVVLV